MDYYAWYRTFKRALDRADIADHRPYDFRHTRIMEVSQFMSHEQLCKFAGWVPGSDRAKVYVHLTSDDVNQSIREEYGLETSEERNEKVMCKFCQTRNDGGSFECRNCKRPLSLEKAEKQKELQLAVEVYDRLQAEGGVENLQKLEKLIQNAERIDELLSEEA